MAKNTTTEDKPKRTVLTPAERVAKLEAELAAAKAKAEAKANKAINALIEKREKLEVRIADLKEQHVALEFEIANLQVQADAHLDETNEV